MRVAWRPGLLLGLVPRLVGPLLLLLLPPPPRPPLPLPLWRWLPRVPLLPLRPHMLRRRPPLPRPRSLSQRLPPWHLWSLRSMSLWPARTPVQTTRPLPVKALKSSRPGCTR